MSALHQKGEVLVNGYQTIIHWIQYLNSLVLFGNQHLVRDKDRYSLSWKTIVLSLLRIAVHSSCLIWKLNIQTRHSTMLVVLYQIARIRARAVDRKSWSRVKTMWKNGTLVWKLYGSEVEIVWIPFYSLFIFSVKICIPLPVPRTDKGLKTYEKNASSSFFNIHLFKSNGCARKLGYSIVPA